VGHHLSNELLLAALLLDLLALLLSRRLLFRLLLFLHLFSLLRLRCTKPIKRVRDCESKKAASWVRGGAEGGKRLGSEGKVRITEVAV
jgi:hypothetical protein